MIDASVKKSKSERDLLFAILRLSDFYPQEISKSAKIFCLEMAMQVLLQSCDAMVITTSNNDIVNIEN
jgi:hypothetical protein